MNKELKKFLGQDIKQSSIINRTFEEVEYWGKSKHILKEFYSILDSHYHILRKKLDYHTIMRIGTAATWMYGDKYQQDFIPHLDEIFHTFEQITREFVKRNNLENNFDYNQYAMRLEWMMQSNFINKSIYLEFQENSRVIYEIDKDFYSILKRTKREIFNANLLNHIPFKCFYLDLTSLKIPYINGCFVYIQDDYYDKESTNVYTKGENVKILNISLVNTHNCFSNIWTFNLPIKNNVYLLKDKKLREELDNQTQITNSYLDIISHPNSELFFTTLFDILYYLCTDEIDYIVSNKGISTTKEYNSDSLYVSEITTNILGYRQGMKLRKYRTNSHSSSKHNHSNKGRKYSAHMVRGHYQHYYYGPKGNQKKVKKWVAEYYTGQKEDIQYTIRGDGKTKDPITSKGQEIIEKLLKQKNISFQSELRLYGCKDLDFLPFDIALCDMLKDDYFHIREDERILNHYKNQGLFLIEIDGEQHDRPISFGSSNSVEKICEDFRVRRKHDLIKNKYCEKHNIPLLRIHYTQINMIEIILQDFLNNPNKYVKNHYYKGKNLSSDLEKEIKSYKEKYA